MSHVEQPSSAIPEMNITPTDEPNELVTPNRRFDNLRRIGEGIATTAVFAVATAVALRAFETTALMKDSENGAEEPLTRAEAEGLQGNISRRVEAGEISEDEAEEERKQVRQRYLRKDGK